VGGEEASFQRTGPILERMGEHVFYMGKSGMGNSMKLVVNTLLGLEMQAIAEALALGEKAGLEKQRLLEVLGQTSVIAPSHKAKLENARRDEYPAAFAIGLMHKDFGLLLEQAGRLALPMPATAAAQQMCGAELTAAQRREHDGTEDEDYSAVIRTMEDLAGIAAPLRAGGAVIRRRGRAFARRGRRRGRG
jgi:3-hydroxyisobutyrate dehydrogenase-like beta-hydroxyacid dehydrogenase